jgi:hypothetical protein
MVASRWDNDFVDAAQPEIASFAMNLHAWHLSFLTIPRVMSPAPEVMRPQSRILKLETGES